MPRPNLARLFDAEQARLLALCTRLTGDRAAAEDALQDTFLLAHRHLKGFRGDAAPETWLYRIAIRAATRRRERERAAAAAARERNTDACRTPNQHADQQTDRHAHADTTPDTTPAAVRTALDALPEHHRLVLTLLSLRGLPARVVAEILGVPEGTVYSRAHAARHALRAELERRDPEPRA